jgi:hypothetical protein
MSNNGVVAARDGEWDVGDRTTVRWCTYNIEHHGLLRLQLALKNMARLRMDFGFMTETKIANGLYPKEYWGYNLHSTIATNNQGGVTLFYRENANYTIELIKEWGPNVLSCVVVSGGKRWTAVGIYIPPNEVDGTTLAHLDRALKNVPAQLLLAGDLNVDIISPRDNVRDTEIVTALTSYGLDDMGRHFLQRKRYARRWTFWKKANGRVVKARCDAMMGSDQRWFRSVRILNQTDFESDHFMLVGEITAAPAKEHKDYLRGRKAMPDTTIDGIDTVAADGLVSKLMEFLPERERPNFAPKPDWVSAETWKLMEERVQRKKNGTLTEVRRLVLKRRIRSGLKLDRKRRATTAAAEMEALWLDSKPTEAWQIAKRWYRRATGRPAPPAREDMETTADLYEALYTADPPAGVPIPIPLGQIPVDDSKPSTYEIVTAIKSLRNGRAPGVTGIRAEDLKQWVKMHESEEGDSTPFETLRTLVEGAFVTILVLLPKPNSSEFRGIGLLDSIWKLMTTIINNRINPPRFWHFES